jgi:hypothetical protein
MKEEHRKKIKEITGDMKCPKNFSCAEGGLRTSAKRRILGLTNTSNVLKNITGGVGLLYDSQTEPSVNVRCECIWPRS